MSDELKPCPFCGSNNLIEGYHSPFVICDDCGAFGPGHADLTHDEAVEAWNSRAERTCRIESSYLNDFTSNHECWYEFEMQCGYKFTWDEMEPPTYCPNCGAKVRNE